MCGFVGYITRQEDRTSLPRMLTRIAHRGPDGEGQSFYTYQDWFVALGHRRLSILDIEGGAQPMHDGHAHIVFNGEIYNYRDLLKPHPLTPSPATGEGELLFSSPSPLGGEGFRVRSDGDTAALLRHIHAKKESGLVDLNGMFAFALWDQQTGSLLLARDRAGIKPLYYAPLADGGLVFGSELTAVMAHPGVSRDLNPAAVASYFFLDYAAAPGSFIQSVSKLEPAHSLRWTAGKLESPKRFWKIPSPQGGEGLGVRFPSESELCQSFSSHLETAVRRQLMADVPVGIFLSGGLDSSSVAALAVRASHVPMKAFSIGFENPEFDEIKYARLVSKHLGIEHVEHIFREQDLLRELDHILDALDEPLADPSFLPTYLLSRLAAREVKVALGGDGGDELWGGYPTYWAHKIARVYAGVPEFLRKHFIESFIKYLPVSNGYQSLEWKLKRFAGRFDSDPVLCHLRWMSSTDLPDLQKLCLSPLSTGWRGAGGEVPESPDTLQRMMALDFMSYMPGSVLTKVDRASMANSLEVRPPLLDNDMIDFAFSVPSKMKIQGRIEKALFKKAMRGQIPDEILDRKKKGFAIPLASWMAGPLLTRMQAIMQDSPVWELGLLNQALCQQWLSEHELRKVDRSRPLWALLVFDHWMRKESR